MKSQILAGIVVLVQLIHLNSASVQELDRLPGIGPVLARRIVEFRERRDGFRRVEELLAVPGISERRWQALKDRVTVEEEPQDNGAPASNQSPVPRSPR